MNEHARQAPVVSGHQMLSAGFAAAAAAFVTSRFGVAGTLLGAALTAMIVTGGSAILRAYFESVTGNVRKVPRRLQERRNRWKAGRTAEPPDTMPGRPDLRDNFAGRMRAALEWFSHLPPLTRRSILVKGLIAAAVAFVISVGAVYAVERGIGNSLSCGIWANCPDGAKAGVHIWGGRGTGASPSLSLGRAKTNVAPGYKARNPALQQNPSYQQKSPGYRQPVPLNDNPGHGIVKPDLPAKSPAQPASPSSASPAPGGQTPSKTPSKVEKAPAQEVAPSDASPAPSQ